MRYLGRILIVLALAGCGRRAQPPPAPHRPPVPPAEEHYDIGFYRALIYEGGPAAILDRLYVAPPSIFPSLMDGISSGTPVWLDLYQELRREADRQGAVGTIGQLDEALARAVAANAEGVLRFARAHPAIPMAAICSRTAPVDQDRADVVDARGMLGMIRRQRTLERVTDRTLVGPRDVCLEAVRPLVRRQLRIYLVSHGAPGVPDSAGAPLSEPERRELDAELVSARRDGALRARLDGRFPDGPFRLAQIPPAVLACCRDEDGLLANPEGPWEFSDSPTDDRLPRARLLNACKLGEKVWDITFQKGGFTTRLKRVRARLTDRGWSFAEMAPAMRTVAPNTDGEEDYWADCRTMSAD